jgi:hypothetical protein
MEYNQNTLSQMLANPNPNIKDISRWLRMCESISWKLDISQKYGFTFIIQNTKFDILCQILRDHSLTKILIDKNITITTTDPNNQNCIWTLIRLICEHSTTRTIKYYINQRGIQSLDQIDPTGTHLLDVIFRYHHDYTFFKWLVKYGHLTNIQYQFNPELFIHAHAFSNHTSIPILRILKLFDAKLTYDQYTLYLITENQHFDLNDYQVQKFLVKSSGHFIRLVPISKLTLELCAIAHQTVSTEILLSIVPEYMVNEII